mgnify:CR=1 FL=1
MKQLNKVQSTLFLIGGMLMVVGAGSYVFMWHQRVVCWVFMLGACLFAAMQMSQTYEGRSLTIKRLKRIMSVADMFFVLSGLLMVDNANALLLPYFHSYTLSWCITSGYCCCWWPLCLRYTLCTVWAASSARKRIAPPPRNNQKKY